VPIKVQMTMIRMMFVTVVYALLSGTAFAQTPPPTQVPPPTQPPPTQQPPPAGQKPTVPTAPATPPAEPAPFPAESKFAFISPQAVLSQSELGKSGQKLLEDLQKKKQAELDAITKKMETLQTEIKNQAATLSPDALQAKQREYNKLQMQDQFERQQAQSEMEALNRKLLDEFEAKVLPIINEIRKERNLLAIFAVQPGDNGGMSPIAFDPGLDLTLELVKRLNAKK
jgi:Skp family chaperone for outer membrane proteins